MKILARIAAAAIVLSVTTGAGSCSLKKPTTPAERAKQDEEDGYVTSLVIDEVGRAVSGEHVGNSLAVQIEVSAGDGN